MSVEAVIARCTRDGVTSWQNVAAQLGCSVEAARKRYDPQYLHIRPWPHPCEEIPPSEEPIDENDTHSLVERGPGMAVEILGVLQRHGPLSVSQISGLLNKERNSVRMRLSRMCGRGWVVNDSRGRGNGLFEWTWRLTANGHTVAVTGCAGSIRERA